ncbi:L,D-transpeptidase family protein [Halomonas sp. KAO]|uniref:L,D-transpeptidase family protein n=1 Tax=Halomonas sp. KAO TaxID=2783858 RepID=UPI00189EC48D|nr:L,D-transpeptidase family protein [Halomonas sp. KAO]MBF7052648.1 L,D-transpeptidase family protein [Halomonas sp. KAO]
MTLIIMLVSGMVMGEPSTPQERRMTAVEQALVPRGGSLEAFYTARAFQPAWTREEQVKGLVEALQGVARDGLDPADYGADRLLAEYRQALASDELAQARFDIRATRALYAALRHLHHGKVDPHSIDPQWEVPINERLPPLERVTHAVEAGRVAALLDSARPAYAPYERLRQGLARYRNIQRLGGWPMLPEGGPALRRGVTHPDVAILRDRLAQIGELEVMAADTSILPAAKLEAPDPQRFDAALEAAVRRFQDRHLLEMDGVVGPRTREALNVPVGRRIDQIRLNLERARWLMHGLPNAFVLVDIAGYRVSYFRPNGDVWRSRIVVGQPYRRTPSLRSEITHLTVNPTWTVPPTILREDVIPSVRRDPSYLARRNMQVLTPSGRRLSPSQVDWSNPGSVMIRQAAGPGNALGQVVVRFPNDHLVYLHDTPAKGLFARQRRAFSSGCIRVQGVLQLAQLLFDDTGSDRDLRALLASSRTRNVPLAEPVPIILHYWTVHPDAGGRMVFRPDIYARDDALLRALDRPLASL